MHDNNSHCFAYLLLYHVIVLGGGDGEERFRL